MEFAELIKTTRVDNVVLKKAHTQAIEGTLCLTGHLLIFSSRLADEDELMLQYSLVENVHRKFTNTHGVLTMLCKDFTSFKLRIPGVESAHNIASSVEALSTLENPALHYPFFYRLDFGIKQEGWLMYTLENEYRKVLNNCSLWKVSPVNKDYSICPSYPEMVMVPLAATDDIIIKSSKFRQGGRFPILAYLHGKDFVPLIRCAQPLNGQGKRCKEDEKLLNLVLSGHGKKGMIIDTRATPPSTSQKGRGFGYELESNYPQWKRSFQNIERYLALTDSIARLCEACSDIKGGAWLTKLEGSGWLGMVDAILTSAMAVAELMENERVPVFVHGDTSTDMTLAVTSLAQLLLDTSCRTIDGFQSLIVREWIFGGHPFSDRNTKLGVSTARYKGQGPVFLLFLDCVHQVLRQYPCSFEFNESLLLTVAKHSYGSPYGTFLFNNERERKEHDLSGRTTSLWSYMSLPDVKSKFVNVLYEENRNILHPSNAPQSLCVWAAMFLKWSCPHGYDSEKSLYDSVRTVKDRNLKLKIEARELQREHEELRQTIIRKLAEEKSN